MRFLAWVLVGILLAAILHLAMMSPDERAGILRVTPAPAAGGPATGQVDATDPRAAPRGSAEGTHPDAPATEEGTDDARTRTESGPISIAGAPASMPTGLAMPVQGVEPEELMQTFADARSGGRVHEALDIMAPAGTPVLAVADGHVEKLFNSRQGGLTIYQFEPSGRHAYYYAHLERYAPGLAEGQAVRRGQVLGYVGSSGNADPAAPHLHFAIFALGPERRWWEGTPIDPYPVLAEPRQAR